MGARISRFTLSVFGALAVLGLANGITVYLNRPQAFPPNDPANNAIALHIAIAIALVLAVVIVQTYRNSKQLPAIWLAPFTEHALSRLKRTFRSGASVIGAIRVLVCLVGLFLVLWPVYRSSLQVTAAFSPAFTANAWGGPSYLGASLAHWMDDAIMFYLGALVLWFAMYGRRHSVESR